MGVKIMPNAENLIGHRWGKDKPAPTSEQARKNGSLGGKTRAENAERQKTFAEYAKIALATKTTDIKGNEIDYKSGIILRLVKKSLGGDTKSTELLMKLVGEMPSEKTEITGANGMPINPPVINILPVKVKNE